jgi:hypothetical protein
VVALIGGGGGCCCCCKYVVLFFVYLLDECCINEDAEEEDAGCGGCGGCGGFCCAIYVGGVLCQTYEEDAGDETDEFAILFSEEPLYG